MPNHLFPPSIETISGQKVKRSKGQKVKRSKGQKVLDSIENQSQKLAVRAENVNFAGSSRNY